jgi:hypothetical protein
VTINLQLGRWRCRNSDCARQIFTERVSNVLIPHARQTDHLAEIRMLVGRALGGRPGQRLSVAPGSLRVDALAVAGYHDHLWML